MGLLSKFRGLFNGKSLRQFVESTIQYRQGFGSHGSRPRPFDYNRAVQQFNSWAYSLMMLNANAVANVPKRLLVHKPDGMKSSWEFATKSQWRSAAGSGKAFCWETKPLSQNMKGYLGGRENVYPSDLVRQKIAVWGGNVEEVTDRHPILQLLQQPNPVRHGYEYEVLQIVDLQLSGNMFEYVNAGRDGIPTQLWRMAPQDTKIIPVKRGNIRPDGSNFVDGYVYGRGAEETRYGIDEVNHARLPNPEDPWYGKGCAEAAWTALGLHQSKREMDTARFDNMCAPDFLVSAKGMTKEQLTRLEDAIKEKRQGTQKAGGLFTVNSDVTAIPLQWDHPEIGTPDRVVEELCATFDVPVAMVRPKEGRGNEEARILWYRNTISRYCRNMEENRNMNILPRFPGSENMVLACDHTNFEDEGLARKNALSAATSSILTVNEARAEIGYEAIEGGDVRLPPAGSAGAGAALLGDAALNQNDRRTNEDQIR